MRYKLLGRSGLRISEVCLGTMTFGEDWGWGASKEISRRIFDLFAEAGGNFIDTSVNYTNGTSEKFVGEFIARERERFVVASKYTLTRPESLDPNSGGNSRKNMRQSVEHSLKHLGTDYIDLYYLHMWDYLTPIDEVMRGLDDLVTAGKVLYVGFSDSPAWVVSAANMLAELRGWSRLVALQLPYSLLDRAIERDLIPMANYWEMAVLPWGLLEAGLLTGKYSDGKNPAGRLGSPEISARTQAVVNAVQEVAREVGRSAAQVAINWARQQPHALMIPILGARTEAQLKDNLACIEWSLTPEQLKQLSEAATIDLGFPHGFLDNNPYVFGSTRELIDDHRAGRR